MITFIKQLLAGVAALVLAPAALAQPAGTVTIPGTKCSLAAPPGFSASTSFSGFQNPSTGGFIMINELPAPVKTVTDGFTGAAMKARGMKLLKTEQTRVRDLPATMLTVTQETRGTSFTKYLLIFGQGDVTMLITAGFPEGSAQNPDVLRQAITRIECNPALIVDPLAAAPFTLNTTGSEFKPVKFVGGSLLYATDGKVPTDKPVLIAGRSLGKTAIENRKSFAETRLRQLPGAERAVVKQSTDITIDGLPGYELIAEGSGKDGIAALVYQVILYDDNGSYFLIVGQATERVDGLTETYRTIARSFHRK